MTVSELERAVASKNRVKAEQSKEQARYDYILADLIGRSISRVYNSANKMPDIEEAYPGIFMNPEELKQEKENKQAELSALRFKQFAQSFNQKFTK